MSFSERLDSQLAIRRENNLYRSRKELSSAQGERVYLSGETEPFLNFCSNDYLGLASHPEIIKAYQNAANEYGVGSGASHLVIGHHKEHQLLEEELAEFLGTERALVFGSGYSTNVGVLTTLLQKGDSVFQDKLNHASLLDGGLFSGAKFQRYLHNDMRSLEKKIESASKESEKLIVSDAVFSMDGDSATIAELIKQAKKNNAWLMLDDAHGFGVLGKQGRGSVNAQACLQQDIDVYMATFGKAIGTGGAFVAGSALLIETLIQFCRHYMYTTAMPPALAAATRQSLKIIQKETWRQENLQERIQQFKAGIKVLNFDHKTLSESQTAIQPIILGSAQQALTCSEKLKDKGYLISAIRPPTVAKNTSRLRVTLSANHSEQQVDALLNALSTLTQERAE
jgi:8-amino-7-oxononanoate synthase